MTSPKRTTFEVKVSNLLETDNTFIQLQSALRYVQTLSSTNFAHNVQDKYNQNSSLISRAKSSKNSYSKSDYNEHYNESKSSSHDTSRSTESHDANASASFCGFGAEANYSYNGMNESSHSRSDHNINSGKSATSLSTNNQLSNATTDIINNINSNKSENTNKSSLQSSLMNKTVQPGFVRIVPGQTLSIPVVVERESQVVYLSVYISNDKLLSHKCIANQLQINVQHIQIVEMNGSIAIKPMIKPNVGFRKLLQKWNLPESLIDCMEKCGWTEPRSWDNIRPCHLEEMGFKAGHVDKFNNGYKEWKKMKNWLYNDITYKALFELWALPNYLYDNLIKNGWQDIKFWSYLLEDDKYLKELGFKQGHIVIFKHHIKDNQHLKDWDNIKQEFEKNKENHDDSKYDDDYDAKATRPQFNIINVMHNSAHIELLNIIKSNEYYRIELCEKHDDNDNDHIWNHILTIKKGQKHKIKLDKMDTTYLIRIRSRNHQFDTMSDYTMKSFKTKNKQWMIDNIKDIKNFKYKIDLVDNQKLDFILIEFNKSDINNLNKDNMNNNKYFIEIATGKALDETKQSDELVWNEIAMINERQVKYIINFELTLNKPYSFRIKSINDFEYIQFSNSHRVITMVSQQYHPYECEVKYEHSEIEHYHPQKISPLGGCECSAKDVGGCQQRYKCCKQSKLNAKGCMEVYYHRCCNQKQHSQGCAQKYVCQQS